MVKSSQKEDARRPAFWGFRPGGAAPPRILPLNAFTFDFLRFDIHSELLRLGHKKRQHFGYASDRRGLLLVN